MEHLKKMWEVYQAEFNIQPKRTEKDSLARAAFYYVMYSSEYHENDIADAAGYDRGMVFHAIKHHETRANKKYNPRYADFYNNCMEVASCILNEKDYEPQDPLKEIREQRLQIIKLQQELTKLKSRAKRGRIRLNRDSRVIPIAQFTKDGKFIKSFNSVKEASEKLNINKNSIYKAISGEYRAAGGFIFDNKLPRA